MRPFLELLLLKCNKNAVFYFKITQNKVKGLFFFLKSVLIFMFKTLDKVYINQLKSYNPTNRKKHKTLLHSIALSLLNPGPSHYLEHNFNIN